MGSEEGKRSGELRAAEGIVELPLLGEPGTATGDERLGRLARAAVVDDSNPRRKTRKRAEKTSTKPESKPDGGAPARTLAGWIPYAIESPSAR